VHSGVFDPRGAERVRAVRRAPRGEKTPLGAVHRRPQQKVGEICGLVSSVDRCENLGDGRAFFVVDILAQISHDALTINDNRRWMRNLRAFGIDDSPRLDGGLVAV